jgi:hypothetical protein
MDDFTGEAVSLLTAPVTTELPYDITIKKGQGLVVQ